MPTIRALKARVCYNSRGQEALEVDTVLDSSFGRACSPAGASVGKFEAPGFPQGGAEAALRLFEQYSQRLVGMEVEDVLRLTDLMREIDGTENYSGIGGSAAYALTVSFADACARARGIPLFELLSPSGPYELPYPLGNVLGGGKHAGRGAPDIQEFLVCPVGAKTIRDALKANIAVHGEVRRRIEARDPLFTGGRGDEGAWAPRMNDEEAFEVVSSSVEAVSSSLGVKVETGIDFAASSLWDGKRQLYVYERSGVTRSPAEQVEYVVEAAKKYNLIYLEDPFDEEAFDDFSELTKKLPNIYVVGDDLFVTNPHRLKIGVERAAANAAILKVNQAGGLGDAIRFSEEASRAGYSLITSHRSGDTTDPHIAHVAVATRSKMLKTGVVGGERMAKLNELLRIGELPSVRGMVKIGP